MNKRTLKALKASIAHWAENMDAEKPEDASDTTYDCALCSAFNRYDMMSAPCKGCPVSARTGESTCGGTPYHNASCALSEWEYERTETSRDTFHAAAKAEHDFLVSLLPEGESS